MPDFRLQPRPVALVALLAGLLLAGVGGWAGGISAAVAAWLAQPAVALGVSWLRGTRVLAPSRAWREDVPALMLAWAVAFAGTALLLAWPLASLRDSGSLPAALGVSAVVGAVIVALWRTWPLWHGLERDGGALSAHWRGLVERDFHAWRGLAVATLLTLAVAGGLSLAWTDLVPDAARTGAAVAYALLLPLVHWGVQRLDGAGVLAVVEMPGSEADAFHATVEEEAPGHALDLEQALFDAARTGRVDRALELLEAGADPHALPAEGSRDQRSLGALAAVLPDLRLLRTLIAHGVDLNHAHAGVTPLLAATRDSWHGRPDAVTTLLANGADPRIADADGNTPLHHAARSSDPGVVALLRDAAAELDALNHDGLTPLGVACVAGNWRLAKFLLERGARPDPQGGQPVLLAAASTEEDDPAGVQLLLKHKAKVDARDAQRRSALHEGAYAGHAEIAASLLAAGADVHARDAQQRTPWLEAARGGHLGVLEKLAEAGADRQAVDADRRNALMLACAAEHASPALVRRLREWGIDPEATDALDRRAVDLAAEAGRWALVSALDPGYALPTAVATADDETPPDRAPAALLREGLASGQVEGMEALARLSSRDELGALLHDAEMQRPTRLAWLLRQGADPEYRNAHGDTIAFALLSQGPAGMPALATLLARAVSPAGAGGLARFMAACASDDQAARTLESCALDLLERGADPFAPSPQGDPALSLAVRLGWQRVLDRLLDIGVDREARDSHGMTALHLAAVLGRETALKHLIAKGASPESRAADGQTPLGVALACGRRDLADWLDWRIWSLPRRALRPADLPAAAMAGDRDAVRRLLDLGFDVDSPDAQGCTALLRAAGGGFTPTVELLLARGADAQRAANTGATPLSAAVSMRQADIVSALLAAGADIEYRLPGGVTVLMLAAALGLPEIVARLINAGANVHAGDAQGLTPLHCAALYGFTAREKPRLVALLDTLLLSGAESEQVAAGSVTPLLLLLGSRAEPGTACDEEVVLAGLERLLDEDVSLDVQDPRGFGPLHLASLHGLLRVVSRLLRAGADPELRDALNRTPREIAVMRGFIDVAAEFVPATPGAGASMARFLRDRG
ncbi:ankyrin repeat domain-containing protein [Pseudoxanthomonas sp. SE1]|uniref:ankyrin repeat domain-containing protein n=1 Tax=Pseudoxanthomonas sp. SE1 TaxID=1664560 RepID=UPI00240E822E|nr:ankyrin repeat domain-containing protein [Pseudoxanthomonas sp. SE1]WFC41782.1 ankyrin repeat domain-containing protein [Pseudoxanthomonas sp. SE1]